VVPDYTTPALYRTKEPVFLRGAASPPPYISLAAPVFSHELPAHDLESDESLCDLGLRVVRGAVEAKECENWYHFLVDSCGTQPDAIWDLLSNAHSREECLADPKLPRRWGTRPGKLISSQRSGRQLPPGKMLGSRPGTLTLISCQGRSLSWVSCPTISQ
jgi:hypothetical protein